MKSNRPAAKKFVDRLASLDFDSAFNPYAQSCRDHDGTDAPAIRRRNLTLVLDAALTRGVDSLWIARDLGYRGGRRTGLALTDEVHLGAHASLFNVPDLVRSTRGPVMSERTATVIWQALTHVARPIFLWNVFPLHPHECDDPMSNRCHTRAERHACKPLLIWLLEHLQPKSVVAIGRDAQLALVDMGVTAHQVRHPSYGGQAEFLDGIYSHYGVRRAAETLETRLF